MAVRLKKITFKTGARPGEQPLDLTVPAVTVLVGPNNAGKSLALRELEAWCVGKDAPRKIIDNVTLDLPNDDGDAERALRAFETTPPADQVIAPGHVWIGSPSFSAGVVHEQVNVAGVLQSLRNGDTKNQRMYFSRLNTVRLDGKTRFSLSDPKPTGDLQLHPQNHLWALFRDDAARERVRRYTQEAFGKYFVVDPTAMSQFRVRMSDRAPVNTQEEQGLDQTSRDFHAQAKLVSELSDGVQAFTGLTSAVLSLPHTIILIDEPEAFLHPPLARRLGSNLTKVALEREASLVVATHSADFLMGCIEAAPDLRIVRFTYDGGVATVRSVPSNDLKKLMKDPILRSTQALRGVFHRAVVITEADSDRAFYEEANRRLVDNTRGTVDTLFLNARNWQTVPSIAKPLRALGIPTAMILDLDVVADADGTRWGAIYDTCGITDTKLDAVRELRRLAKAALETDSDRQYKRKGVMNLPESERTHVETFIEHMKLHGVFIVTVGELECWLSTHETSTPKETWLERIFTAMGDDTTTAQYVHPSTGDVWDFLDTVSRWIADPGREGMNF